LSQVRAEQPKPRDGTVREAWWKRPGSSAAGSSGVPKKNAGFEALFMGKSWENPMEMSVFMGKSTGIMSGFNMFIAGKIMGKSIDHGCFHGGF
jgi:hypothetical protein